MTEPYGRQVDATDRHLEPVGRTADRCIMKDVTDMPLFIHEPSMNDIHQMGLGDCYFEAVIGSLVSEHPERVKELMKDNGDGTVTVCWFKEYEKMEVMPPSLKQACKSTKMQNIGEMSNYDIIVNLFGWFREDLISAQEEAGRIKQRVNDEVKNGIFQRKEYNANTMPAIDKIAKRMAEDARFIPICDAIRAIGGEYAGHLKI